MKLCRRIVDTALALALVAALLLLLLGLWPAPVINHIAQHWLNLDLKVGAIDYRLKNGRLLCHIQQLAYRHSTPALELQLEHLALDVNLERLRSKHITVNELVVTGAKIAIVQGGTTPWWREFSRDSAATPKDETENDARWQFHMRSIQGQNIRLLVDLLQQQRQNDLHITRFSSGQSPNQKRWLQIRGNINDYPLLVDGELLAAAETVDQVDAFSIDWEVRLADAFLYAKGRVDPFQRHGNTDVKVALDVTSLPRIAAMLGLELPHFEAAAVSMNIIGANTGFALDNIAINVRSDNSAIVISGSVAQPLQQWSPDLQVSADVNSMQTLLSRLGITMATDFYARAQGHLVRSNGLLELRKLRGGIAFSGFEIPGGHQFGITDATLTLLKDEITGWQGPFELPLSIQGGSARSGLKLADEVLFYELPIGQLALQVRGDGMDLAGQAAYKQRPIDINFSMAEHWQTLAGEIRTTDAGFTLTSDFSRPWLPLAFTAAIDNLTLLNDWLRLDFPEDHALSASGSVHIATGQPLSLHNFQGRIDHDGSITVRIPHYRFAAHSDAQLALDLALPSTGATVPLLNELIDYANTERWRYTLQDLSTSAADRELVSRELISVQPEQQLHDKPWLEGSLQAALRLRSSGEQRAIDHVKVDFSGQDLTLQTRGFMSQEKNVLDGELYVDLGLAAQPGAGRRAALNARGRLLWQDNTLLAEGLEISSTPASRMRVNLSLADPLGEHPKLIADVYSDQWDLRPWFGKDKTAPSSKATQQSPPPDTEQSDEAPRLFSATPWSLEFLHKFDGLVSLTMHQIQLQGFALDQLRTNISLRAGELNLFPLSIVTLGGSMVAAFSRQLQQDTSHWRLKMRIDDIDAAHYQTIQQDNREAPANQGRVSALVDLTSQGDSPREVMTHLSGRITEHISNMIIYGVDLDALAPNVLRQVLEMLNPFRATSDALVKTHIECQVGHALFGDGLMYIDRSLLMRTPYSTFVLSWFIDFATEQQRLQVIPRLRRGIALSTTELARTAQLSGTLLQPRLVANTGGLFLLGAGSAALYATGGWLYYFAWRQIERALARTDACERAATNYFRQDWDDLKLPVRTDPLADYPTEPQSSR